MLYQFPIPLQIGEDPSDGTVVLGFIHDDTFIFDPFMSSCSRFEVDPKEAYGIPVQAAEGLSAMNRHLYAAADEVSKHVVSRAHLAVQMGVGLSTDPAGWPSVDMASRHAVARTIAQEMLVQLGQRPAESNAPG